MSNDNNTSQQATPQANGSNGNGNGKRKLLLIVAAIVVLLIALAWGAYWFFVSRFHQTTDDAYVSGHVVQITPQVNGTVIAIGAEETDYVERGKVLVRLNPADADIALQQAEAQLALAVRQARTLYTSNRSVASTLNERRSALKQALADEARAREDLRRREQVAAEGAVSGEELQHARTALSNAVSAVNAARAAVAGAEEELSSSRALTEDTSVANHPSVRQAAARVKAAYLDRMRCEIASPISGEVARRNVQIGQRIQTGTPLMAVVPLKELWVDANFKEDQLRSMRIGQPVTLSADLYGDNVEFKGKVVGLGAGTGAAFSLLPAQNATGNWIKVVQRVPVRIALDPDQLTKHPLRVGLSMEVDVDISDTSGKALADVSRHEPVVTSDLHSQESEAAQKLVNEIIEANLGQNGTQATARARANMREAQTQAVETGK
ncbi:MAG TPA: HlyD family efflux transporter periplasmic adaptor subunit [Methylophilaceae bacterium]|nr:HlyD family efflux transporter periplasmic adaptor subunit [Methylophilaceae bacterium]